MAQDLKDNTGEPVTVRIERGEPVSAFTVSFAHAQQVGRADFVDSRAAGDERIFFHTEVDPEFGGRGLAGLLVREALADSVRKGLTVIPVCPLFARHLRKHGEQFVAAGGAYRTPMPSDIDLIKRLAR
ncbi:N-acetyltransferase [Salinibacterium sp. dk2585]|uniref:GNAT family N-acetyltransferase n=1 Tax=unclassified Salinibacterium TaxID=2632331 RepID=UPI0011C255F1|nr:MULTISPECIES: GNAT family N-acetyltransferase [unclassified Salinibacterium]QEE61007.1 N-acetyltransferase [Salinibacterium sp. dk2585]TXK52949.1 N-acetyltransferase [Salinibacterium sp. dk5596]